METTSMPDTIEGASHARTRVRLAFILSMFYLAVALLAFGPALWVDLVAGKAAIPASVHLHGAAMFSWLALVALQTWFVQRGTVTRHRALGRCGTVVFVGAWLSSAFLTANSLLKNVPAWLDIFIDNLLFIECASLLLTPLFLVLALASIRRDIGLHRALMLLISAQFLEAAVVRLDYLPGLGDLRESPAGLHAYHLLLVAPIVLQSWWAQRRVPRTLMVMIGVLLATKVLSIGLWNHSWWIGIADRIETGVRAMGWAP